ncbi:hypothetical protein HDU67_001355 [Dinochytrium kinnereticum]|nr:hypothetical protein HDU67_001355 [Dinochytrium kinnereticum]
MRSAFITFFLSALLLLLSSSNLNQVAGVNMKRRGADGSRFDGVKLEVRAPIPSPILAAPKIAAKMVPRSPAPLGLKGPKARKRAAKGILAALKGRKNPRGRKGERLAKAKAAIAKKISAKIQAAKDAKAAAENGDNGGDAAGEEQQNGGEVPSDGAGVILE